jgi:hypothetical protein
MEKMNMKKTIKLTGISLLILSVIISILISCDPDFFEDGCHSHINVTNNSSMDICTDETYAYPDTTMRNINPLRQGRKVAAGKTDHGSSIGAAGVCIESKFADVQSDTISIFIFDAKFMENNLNNEDFRTNETMALQRYDLTLDDLNSLNWTISYPPDERMKFMKMYPPYKN